jgi:enoyl-CoA hydratase
MNDAVLQIAQHDRVTLATLNRPTKGNALNTALIDALDELAADVTRRHDLGEVGALVLAAAGGRAFSAGADITELVGLTPDQARAQMRRGQQVFDRLERLPVAVIAAIDGFALGGGLELAMAADLRVASPTSRLGQAEITLANLPGWGGTQRLPQLVGRGRATEMILTGVPVTAEEAERIGLVNTVTKTPLETALELARGIAERSPVAVAGAKRSIRAGLEQGTAAGLLVEADSVADCCSTQMQREAVEAFVHRREQKDGRTPSLHSGKNQT